MNTVINNEDNKDYEIGELIESDEYSNLHEILSCVGEGVGNKIPNLLLRQKDCFKYASNYI